MAKLITKFKYLKPSARQSVGGYAKYIATREGVEKVDDTFKTDPSTEKQKKLIERILRDFPDSNSMLEYEDYLKEPTLGNASEFITRALEDNANEALNTKTYADYIATRPRAERFGSHGLFTDDGVRVKLEDVSRELNEYEGNVWTVIISLRREDAERLGFNSGERWRDMLRTQTETIAKNFKIPVEDLKWYAAFHNESHHPHVHLMVYSSEQAKPYAPAPRSVQRSRMWQLYRSAKELLDRESNTYDPNTAVDLLIEAAGLGCGTAKYRLGKMFLRGEDVPKNIDYALRWLEESASEHNQYAEYLLGKTFLRGEDVDQDLPRAEHLLRRSSDQGNRYASYTLGKTLLDGELLLQNIPEAIRLLTDSADKGFAAGQYQMGKLLYRGEVVPQDVSRAIEYLERSAEQKNPYAAYLAGKLRLTEAELKDVLRAIRDFEIAAENGNDYAEYQLGKIYLYGKEVERDYENAIAYLSSAAEHGNQYAEQLLHSIQSNRNWSAALGSIRLLHHLSRMIQNQLDDERKGKAGAIERKLKRKIDEKKQAHGLKQG